MIINLLTGGSQTEPEKGGQVQRSSTANDTRYREGRICACFFLQLRAIRSEELGSKSQAKKAEAPGITPGLQCVNH
jgi:hypothetical protein